MRAETNNKLTPNPPITVAPLFILTTDPSSFGGHSKHAYGQESAHDCNLNRTPVAYQRRTRQASTVRHNRGTCCPYAAPTESSSCQDNNTLGGYLEGEKGSGAGEQWALPKISLPPVPLSRRFTSGANHQPSRRWSCLVACVSAWLAVPAALPVPRSCSSMSDIRASDLRER